MCPSVMSHDCFLRLDDNRCPICRGPIRGRYKAYFAGLAATEEDPTQLAEPAPLGAAATADPGGGAAGAG